ncbi:MAG: phage terminase large subunit [Alphaproteobacteria bacterium GM202ARS2]|nr:phage terminase large subunit [Alphaproteobacteria bacterium GM202ARS2]
MSGAEGLSCSFSEFVWLWNEHENKQTPSVHLQMSRWLESQREAGNSMVLLAFRGAGKSTLVGLFCAWLLLRDRELRILVLAAEHRLAAQMTRHVRQIIERHPLTSHLRSRASQQDWAHDHLTVERLSTGRDPSLVAKGLEGNVTGSRADVIIYDDVEVPNTSDTPSKRAALRARLSESRYVLVPSGVQVYIGTPHCYETIYKSVSGCEPCYLEGFSRLEVPVLDSEGESVWGERFSLSALAELKRRTGPRRFSAQMLLTPQAREGARLDCAGVLSYRGGLDYREAHKRAILSLQGRRLVAASCWWDPAWGEKDQQCGSVIAVVYRDERGDSWLHRVRWLDGGLNGGLNGGLSGGLDGRTSAELGGGLDGGLDNATVQCRQVVAFVRDYFISAVNIETNGIGKFLQQLLRRELVRAGVRAAVIEQTSTRPKDVRILEAFDALLAARALHVHESVMASPFMDEMRDWHPNGKGRDDALDAVSGCLLSMPVGMMRGMIGGMAGEMTGDFKGETQREWSSWLGHDSTRAQVDFDVLEAQDSWVR